MISKETFVNTINNIQFQRQIDDKVSDALETVCGSYVLFNTENLVYISLERVLKEIFNDEGDWIGWWLYENVDKVIYYSDGKESKKILTPEDLYDFLIENKNPG